jgi:HEAT repeat protein
MNVAARTLAVGVLIGLGVAVVGCGQPSDPKAARPQEPVTQVVAQPQEAPQPKPAEAVPPQEVAPQPAVAAQPVASKPVEVPAPAEPVVFVAPQPPAAQPPAAQPPAAQPPAAQPPATDPANPANPTAKPKEPEYPKEINNKNLDHYLKEAQERFQKDPQVRETAIRTIPLFGPSARKPSVKIITDVISSDSDPGVKVAAITIISSMGFDVRNEVRPSIQTLRNVLRLSTNSIVRMYCVRSLSSFGPDAVDAVPELRTAAGDPSWETRLAVAEALGSVGAPPKPDADPNVQAAKTLLTYMLGNANRTEPCVAVRLEAVKSLLNIGPPKAKNPQEYIREVKEYLDPLAERLKFEAGERGDKGVYVWLLLLQIMYDDRVMAENVKKITKFIEAPDNPVLRMYALQALGIIGPQLAALKVNPQTAAVTGPIADAAIDTVILALKYPEPPLQYAAMNCLARIGKEARKAVPVLEEIKAKPPKKPLDAPADWKPDDTMQKLATDTIDYITGKKKFDDQAADKKDEPKKDGK